MNRLTTLGLAGLAAAAVLTGCSSSVLNRGGDTRCEDFLASEQKAQNEAITKMFKDDGKNAPSNIELTGTRMALQTYCQTIGGPDTAIKEMPRL